jgi:hypothetical protein
VASKSGTWQSINKLSAERERAPRHMFTLEVCAAVAWGADLSLLLLLLLLLLGLVLACFSALRSG